MKLYQIHGFGSIGNNGTASWLKETFPEIELIHPDHPVNPAHCLSFAMRQLLEHGLMTEGGCLYGTWRNRKPFQEKSVNESVCSLRVLQSMIGIANGGKNGTF